MVLYFKKLGEVDTWTNLTFHCINYSGRCFRFKVRSQEGRKICFRKNPRKEFREVAVSLAEALAGRDKSLILLGNAAWNEITFRCMYLSISERLKRSVPQFC